MDLPIIGPCYDNSLPIRRGPLMVSVKLIKGAAVIPEIHEKSIGTSHRHRAGMKNIAQLPVLRVIGGLTPEVSNNGVP